MARPKLRSDENVENNLWTGERKIVRKKKSKLKISEPKLKLKIKLV